MITKSLLNFFIGIFTGVFKNLYLPSVPDDIVNNAKSYINLIIQNSNLLGLLVNIDHLKLAINISIALMTFSIVYIHFEWIKSKIPFLNK